MRWHWIWLVLIWAGTMMAGRAAARDAWVESEGPRPWYTFLKPARVTPAEQLAYARALRDRGSFWRARRHYRALVASWPSAPEAPIAQLELADVLAQTGHAEAVFDAYQHLVDTYAGAFPFDDVFRKQLRIAEETLTERRLRFLFGGVTSPERAVPMLERLVASAPHHPDAPRAQLLLGRACEQAGEIEKAIAAYERLAQDHPHTPEGVEAAYRHAVCLAKAPRRAPGNRQLLTEAWRAFDRFVRRHPDSPFIESATRYRDALQKKRIEAAWEQARFYERRGLHEAAGLAYEQFLKAFPDAPRAAEARRRLEALRKGEGNPSS